MLPVVHGGNRAGFFVGTRRNKGVVPRPARPDSEIGRGFVGDDGRSFLTARVPDSLAAFLESGRGI